MHFVAFSLPLISHALLNGRWCQRIRSSRTTKSKWKKQMVEAIQRSAWFGYLEVSFAYVLLKKKMHFPFKASGNL